MKPCEPAAVLIVNLEDSVMTHEKTIVPRKTEMAMVLPTGSVVFKKTNNAPN